MKISIILPIYNAEQYLAKTITCVLDQTYKDFELILVDDGSKDNSSKIYTEFASHDSRIKIISQINKGVSSARNTGLKFITGEWVCFLDSDDEITTTWLESYINAIETDIDIIVQGAQIIENNKTSIYKLKDQTYTRNEFAHFIKLWQYKEKNIGSAWSKMFKSSIIKKNNITFKENIHNYEDWIFLTSVLIYAQKVKTISANNYIYNHNNSNLTRKYWNASQRITILEARYEAAFQLKSISKECFFIYIADISKLLLQTVSQIYKENYPKQQRIYFLNKYKSYPINKFNLNIKERLLSILWVKNTLIADFIFYSLFILSHKK